jgi:hypothetical protein
MIVVTNLPFKQGGDFLPSPAQAVAIVDRLIDQATILRFGGEPFRKPREVSGAPLDGESSSAFDSRGGVEAPFGAAPESHSPSPRTPHQRPLRTPLGRVSGKARIGGVL